MNIHSLSSFWRNLPHRSSEPAPAPKFVDLAPTASADNAEIYFEALDFATSNENVLNIALTGPYGSGKSSIIKSFLARYRGSALQLSLASFLPDGPTPEKGLSRQDIASNKQEIERSILQQILYGVEAGKLPFSRFKRIQAPKSISIGTSLFITLGLACAWYVISKQAEVLSGAFFKPLEISNWFNYLTAGIVAAFGWKIIHSIYTTSFGLSLKSISLKDVQIAPAATNEESVLNRHLDEILYFFQTTNYDLVVIEDLDRFENSDIFVTLRELNGLINANEGIKRRVRFLYALRDDIFANTDRTKFFEFIVPLIPIINHSNSVDKVLEEVKRIDLHPRLNKQFVREVSRYLTDLRLIRNIFNEYVVYAVNLKADREGLLDPNKLLAVLIYKNVIPKDFAALHRQEGVLSQILGRYDQYISKLEKEIRSELAQIEADTAKGDAQFLRDQSELRKVYAMAVVQQLPGNVTVLMFGNEQVSLAQLAESPRLEEIMTRNTVNYRDMYGNSRAVPLSQVESVVDPTRSFTDRKVEIDVKSDEFRKRSEKRSRDLRAELASLRTRRFNEVVRESAELIDQVFVEVGENRELLKYLVLEGYLDDTYYQYISLFHGGRLSPSDNNFLIKIRAYSNPPPDFPLDNTAEVVASMRAEDFRHHYVLNRFIFDHLLSDPLANSQRIKDATDFIASHFQVCGDFFRSYYANGAYGERLVQALVSRWPDFARVALGGKDGASHAARILAFAPDQSLKSASTAGALRSYFSDNPSAVLAEAVDFDIGRLGSLAVAVDDIASLREFPSVLSFVAQKGLYRISVDNIRHILSQVLGWQPMQHFEKQNYSTLRAANDADLLNRIHADFPTYVNDVLLALESNTEEDVFAIAEVLGRHDVDYDVRAEFLKRQTTAIPNFDDIPAPFHQIILEGKRIEATWENCVGFMSGDAYDQDLLTAYLRQSDRSGAFSSANTRRRSVVSSAEVRCRE